MGKFLAKVKVRLKPVVLDPQGKTILTALVNLGYKEVKDVRVGKLIELEVTGTDEQSVREKIKDMCTRILANPVIEDFDIELERIDEGNA
jgi:phosphoribosylformylglycinamidine synthase